MKYIPWLLNLAYNALMNVRRALIQNHLLAQPVKCVKCQVFGCVKCDESQKCYECDQNLKLDQANNQCMIMDNVCSYLNNFYQGATNIQNCQKDCSPTFYQNMETQTCEETVNCTQIQESKRFSFDERVIEFQKINQNQYLVVGNGCTFALVDQNWDIINVQVLQNLEYYNFYYTSNGQETDRRSFIVGYYGGCSAGTVLKVVNFKTLEVEFEINNTNYEYTVQHVDQINQIVFLVSLYSGNIMLYDAINKNMNQQKIEFLKILFFYQIENQTSSIYLMQQH
ncbi:zinc finger protein (macronuclear) [Tetrahymena thermophila SB210]|uniref:Zinc finger protein n=1 Tax=Tetrahymena thermophila (strain SB210) TaxID=312017 RepID=I7MLE3_TETTS|nr:zinc finger protein [Tetrahymena thermophila SB210]EAS01851.2 zinc finger protein [Tetrahymena thermophila SB210]|eukprot:XP_001022096.2 zinc finger protein [Tetrahymena thermophila SB210]